MTPSQSELVPVTVIAGYLGAGKTTLINNLLASDHGRRLAVLVNDFGSVNLDADLIERHDGETISLTNGCICCSIADSLGDSLDHVLALDPPPDQIVIEASGVADPASVASYGQGWPGCRLDLVAVLADAANVRTQAKDQFVGELVIRQLRHADVLIVTKTDLLDEQDADQVIEWIQSQSGAPVLTASLAGVDHSLILDQSVIERAPIEVTSTATDMFESVTVNLTAPIPLERLEMALASWPDSIVRVKGIVSVVLPDGAVESHAVHRVGRRVSSEPSRAPSATNVLVVIAQAGKSGFASLILSELNL